MNTVKLFEDKKVRSQYDADKEIWFFSIVDIVGILTDQPNIARARNYWKVMKSRLLKEGNESVTNCNQLKLQSDERIRNKRPKTSRIYPLDSRQRETY
jgi:hypothetical protein